MNLLCDFSLHEQSFKEVVLYIELMKRSMKSKTFFFGLFTNNGKDLRTIFEMRCCTFALLLISRDCENLQVGLPLPLAHSAVFYRESPCNHAPGG